MNAFIHIHPGDNAMLATMIGNFQDGSIPGKIQWGSGWWFLDQREGMIQQLNTSKITNSPILYIKKRYRKPAKAFVYRMNIKYI